MANSEIEKLLSGHEELSKHSSYFSNAARPCIHIEMCSGKPEAMESRFGGSPVASLDFDWPTHESAEYVFLGQINFAEIDGRTVQLPESGLLTLFFADDETGELYWGDDGFVLAYYWPDTEGLRVVDSPSRPAANPRRISLKAGLDIPMYKELRDDWPFDGNAFEVLSKLSFDRLPRDYLLGYPAHYSLEYDPTPGPDWMPLVALACHEEFGWYWNDVTQLMVFIENQKLKSNDFSSLKCDSG